MCLCGCEMNKSNANHKPNANENCIAFQNVRCVVHCTLYIYSEYNVSALRSIIKLVKVINLHVIGIWIYIYIWTKIEEKRFAICNGKHYEVKLMPFAKLGWWYDLTVRVNSCESLRMAIEMGKFWNLLFFFVGWLPSFSYTAKCILLYHVLWPRCGY